MPRRPVLLASAFAAAFALLLCACLAATGNWRAALILGAADASMNLTGPGLFESLSEAMIPGMKQADAAAPASALTPPLTEPGLLGTAPAPGAAELPSASAAPAAPGTLPSEDLPGAAGAAAAYGSLPAAGDASEEEDEEKRLERIAMPERGGRGETRMYGGGPARAPARSGPPDAAAVEASFGGMIERLKSRASSGASAASLGGKRPSGEGAAPGGESPVLTRNGAIDAKYDSPTLRALQKANSEAAHSAGMSRDPALEDGTKDHAGRGFDGNKGVRGQVPIEERRGAMGRSSIGLAPEE